MSSAEPCTHCEHIRDNGTRCDVGSDAWPHAERCRSFHRWLHVGGCAFCAHLRQQWCTHPASPQRVDSYHDARKRGQPCGPGARLWERFGFDGWDADRVAGGHPV